jgi:hypothetical protein
VDALHAGRECLFVSQGDSSEAFEFIEEALDLSGCTEFISDEGVQRISILCGVGDDVADSLHTRQKRLRLRSIAVLSRRRVNA